MGSEDEADQSKGRSYRGRTWRTYDLTSSIVPRGTSSHHVVELVFLPIAVGCLLSCGYGLLPDPAELGAINPNAVHDHGQPARQRHNRFLHATAFGDLHCPTLQPRPFCCADQHYLGCLVEHHPHHLVAALLGPYAISAAVEGRTLTVGEGGRSSRYAPHCSRHVAAREHNDCLPDRHAGGAGSCEIRYCGPWPLRAIAIPRLPG